MSFIDTNGGVAKGTSQGAILTHNETLTQDCYYALALSRSIPYDATELNLPTPTGFTKLAEKNLQYNSDTNTAVGLYIKECTAGETIDISLPPDSRMGASTIHITGEDARSYAELQNITVHRSLNPLYYGNFNTWIRATDCYGFEIEYWPSTECNNGYLSILSGTTDDATFATAWYYNSVYLRYRGTQIYMTYNRDLIDGWNTISVKNNQFTINGTVYGSVNTSLPFGVNNSYLTLFNSYNDANPQDRAAAGKIRRVKLYGANGQVIFDAVPAYSLQYDTVGLYATYSDYSTFITANTYDERTTITEEDTKVVEGGNVLNDGICGEILCIRIKDADSYSFDSTLDSPFVYKKDGRYGAVYIAACQHNNIIKKDGSTECYFTQYIDSENLKGMSGLVGGFSQDMASGIEFGFNSSTIIDNAPTGVATFEIRFYDENSVENEKLGTIIRNGIRYTPDASKIIPKYNGTFINDFKIKYRTPIPYDGGGIGEWEVIKFQVPSAISEFVVDNPRLAISNVDLVFSDDGWNIYSSNVPINHYDQGNIIIGGTLNRKKTEEISPCISGWQASSQKDNNPAYGNIVVGRYNALTQLYSGYTLDNVIIGSNNKSYVGDDDWQNWIIGNGNNINGKSYSNWIAIGRQNTVDVDYTYFYPSAVIGGYNRIIKGGNSSGVFVGGAWNTLEASSGGQNIIGLENKVYKPNTVTLTYTKNDSSYTTLPETEENSGGRYGYLIAGRDNTIYGGISLAAGYSNTVNYDITYSGSISTEYYLDNVLFKSRCMIGNANTVAGTLATIGYYNFCTKGAMLLLGEGNRCNMTNSPQIGLYKLPGQADTYRSIIRKSLIIGSVNNAENSGTIIGFLNDATSTNAVFGSSNTTTSTNMVIGNSNNATSTDIIVGDSNTATSTNTVIGKSNNATYANTVIGKSNTVTNSTSSIGNVFGDSNNISGNTGDVFGSNNTVSSGGCHVYGNGNTVNGGSYCVGFGNTAINGSTVFGSSNNVTGGGSWKVIGFNNALQGGGGPVIGNGNTFNSGNMTYGILGYNNTVESGGAAFGCNNNSIGGSIVIGHGNTANSGSTIIGTNNRIAGGGGHYIMGISNEANTSSAQIIGFSNTISAGLAIGKYLSNTDTNGSRITIGAYNNTSVDIGTRVVFGDGTGTSDRHNLFISDYNHNTYFSGNIYGTNLPDAPDTAGTYTLQCVVTVVDDTVTKTYSWV